MDAGLLLFGAALLLCLVFLLSLLAVLLSCKVRACCARRTAKEQPCSCKLSRRLGSGYIHQHDEQVIPV